MLYDGKQTQSGGFFMNKTRTNKALMLCLTAMFMALVCLATMMIQIPIPLGYTHLGNSVILIAVFYFNTKYGILAGSIGSALADLLTGYSVWIIPTLIIKAAFAFTAAMIGKKDNKFKLLSLRTILAVTTGMAVMVVGYTLSGAMIYGGLGAGLASTPGLALEGVANIIAFLILGMALNKIKIMEKLHVS
jgi:uncharacterized membrane protein